MVYRTLAPRIYEGGGPQGRGEQITVYTELPQS